MFDTVILLSGAVEHALLSSVLHAHNAQLQVYPIFTAADLAVIEPEWLERARLIAFATPIAVPLDVLDRLGYGAYRFHPGSPHYPDTDAAQFAVQDGAPVFGATAHRISSRDAAGPIVDVENFSVPQGTGRDVLEHMTRDPMLRMFWRLAGALATQSEPLVQRAVRWGAKREAAGHTATTIELSSSRRQAFSRNQGARSAPHRSAVIRTVTNDGHAVEA